MPHSRFKKGLPAKKMMGGERHNRWGQTYKGWGQTYKRWGQT